MRPSTAPTQIDDDWPGVFIRGDDAIDFHATCAIAAEHINDEYLKQGLIKIAKLMYSCQQSKTILKPTRPCSTHEVVIRQWK